MDALQLLAGTAEARVASMMDLRQGKERTKMARFLKSVSAAMQDIDDEDDEVNICQLGFSVLQ